MALISKAIGKGSKASRQLVSPLWTSHRSLSTSRSFLRISDEVQEALNSKKPVVALETTIYTHGFPYPDNVALASHLESVVRINGGVPATIGIIDGVARVGLSPEELIQLTSSAGHENTLKISRRDLGFVCGLRLAGKRFNGGTTIAGTMVLAHLAGIKVFGTGGLGGVHRGAESTMDISADLTELGRTPVTVISSGCKSFLDIPRTLEYLETQGVGVGTFADGRQGKVDFPAFWSRESGVKSPMVIQNEIEAAAIIHAQMSLPLSSGLFFANPIPEEASIPKHEIDTIIEEAIRQADAAGASGKDNTPFILSKIKELSGGKSIPANRALIESNVRRAAIVARELAILETTHAEATGGNLNHITPSVQSNLSYSPPAGNAAHTLKPPPSGPSQITPKSDIIVAGALAVDFSCDYAPLPGSAAPVVISPQLKTSNPSIISHTLGGVGHNIAKAAHFMGSSVRLYSAVGDDLSGRAALAQLASEGIQTSGIDIRNQPHRTAQYVAVNDAHKDLMLAMADMGILESITAEDITARWLSDLNQAKPKCLLVDANWTSPTLHAWLRSGKKAGALTAFEPVSTAKATRLFTPSPNISEAIPVFPNHLADLATPNIHELSSLHGAATRLDLFSTPDWWRVIDALGIPSSGLRVALSVTTSPDLVNQGLPQQSIQLLPFIPTILTKLGPMGVLLTMLLKANDPRLSSPESSPYVLSRCTNGDPEVGGVYVRLFKPKKALGPGEVVSVNGVGDTFLGALVASISRGQRIEDVIDLAQKAAVLSLKSREAVSPELMALRAEA
ncbi:hypothetical protein AOQ84DRAFT_330647 [Glonium stellatum]|uniref:Carbohydrate kinase PfkB domain-containing protein n=1 Tax=Glonium stellatum TaxID=574774 RepID=A0A8E2FCW5_9PEZI|nr:hypothetical protein AOQ84DRAFT_330647 [Glonium stellatum]